MDYLGIIITILDKIFPWGVKKIIPLIKIEPKTLSFQRSKWDQKTSFFVSNRSDDLLFDVYVMIDIKNCKTENFKIEAKNLQDGFNEKIGEILLNQEMIRLNFVYENGEEFIILKVSKFDPRGIFPFTITVSSGAKIKLKVLKYSKKPSKTLTQMGKVAIPFEVPLKNKKRKFKLKSVSLLMKKGQSIV